METLKIIWTFLKIGLIAFGGGWSTVGIIKNEVVPQWISESEFSSLIAIAQSTPGPIALNAATMIGWNHGGLLTALAATLSVTVAPLILISSTILLAQKIHLNRKSLNATLHTGSLAMMLMTLWVLRPSSLNAFHIALALGTFALSIFTKINILWVIIGAGLLNALLGPFLEKLPLF